MELSTLLPIAFNISKGIIETLLYTVISIFFGFIIGNIIAIYNQLYRNMLSKFFHFYVSLFRGTPVVVQLFIIHFGLPQALGFHLSGTTSVIITLSLNSSAYISEIIRSGIISIEKGQFEAAQSLHIPKLLMWKDIIMPQMYKNSLPNICNEFINLLKETAIVSMIGATDILKRAYQIGAQTYSYLEPLLIAAFYYYILILILSKITKIIERKLEYAHN